MHDPASHDDARLIREAGTTLREPRRGLASLLALCTFAGLGLGYGLGAMSTSAYHARLRMSYADPRPVAARAAWLGVELESQRPIVRNVMRGTPAERLGLRAGDEIAALDGSPVGSSADLVEMTRTRRPGQVVDLLVFRDGGMMKMATALAPRPARRTGGGCIR